MSGDRLEVSVTFDSAKGYIASAPELRQPIVALSLVSLRKRIEIALLSDDVVLQLDGARRARTPPPPGAAQLSRIAQLDERTALPDQCLLSAEADVRPPRRKSGFGRYC
jgi:hypothetical protein